MVLKERAAAGHACDSWIPHEPRVGVGTELIYEADAQSAPLRELERMLEEVRKDIFRPDMPRREQLQGEAGFCAPPDILPHSC